MPVSVSLLTVSASLRVASLNMCTDEYLLLLARPKEIASVSRLSHDPANSSLWRLGRRYPTNAGELESALASRPTAVLTMGGGGRSTSMIARRMGLKTVDLPFPESIEDIERNMVKVAAMLGDAQRAKSWRQRLERLRRQLPATRDAIFLGSGGNSIGASSIGARWMELAGLSQRRLPGGRASLELLALHPPKVLLRSSYRTKERSMGQAWLNNPIVRSADSLKIWTDGRAWTCAGPLMLGEIERLRKGR